MTEWWFTDEQWNPAKQARDAAGHAALGALLAGAVLAAGAPPLAATVGAVAAGTLRELEQWKPWLTVLRLAGLDVDGDHNPHLVDRLADVAGWALGAGIAVGAAALLR